MVKQANKLQYSRFWATDSGHRAFIPAPYSHDAESVHLFFEFLIIIQY